MTNSKNADRRIRRTRKRLQNALLQLLVKKTMAKIQIKEIAEVADVSRATFYLHFETKEQLLFSLIDDVFEDIQVQLIKEIEAGREFDLKYFLIVGYQQVQIHKSGLKWLLEVENKDRLIKYLEILIKISKDLLVKQAGLSSSAHVHDDYIVSYVTGGLYMLTKTWIEGGTQESAEEMGTLAYSLLTRELSSA